MREFLLVALGGALGACGRYALSGYILHHTIQHKFPYGTFAVNLLGCLLAGVLIGVAEKYHVLTTEVRLFLLTGILGGFTTLSAFGVDTLYLVRRGDVLIAFGYVLFSVLCSLAVLWVAYASVPVRQP